jgi:hypothetical protein
VSYTLWWYFNTRIHYSHQTKRSPVPQIKEHGSSYTQYEHSTQLLVKNLGTSSVYGWVEDRLKARVHASFQNHLELVYSFPSPRSRRQELYMPKRSLQTLKITIYAAFYENWGQQYSVTIFLNMTRCNNIVVTMQGYIVVSDKNPGRLRKWSFSASEITSYFEIVIIITKLLVPLDTQRL